VTRSESLDDRLWEFAYETLGCRWSGPPSREADALGRGKIESDKHWAERSAYYLQRFLDSV